MSLSKQSTLADIQLDAHAFVTKKGNSKVINRRFFVSGSNVGKLFGFYETGSVITYKGILEENGKRSNVSMDVIISKFNRNFTKGTASGSFSLAATGKVNY